jgi:hypothetical protein
MTNDEWAKLVRDYFEARDEFDACNISEKHRMNDAVETLQRAEAALRQAAGLEA